MLKNTRYILLPLFILDLFLFLGVQAIAAHYNKIGPPVIINAIIFYFVYRKNFFAYICFYMMATITAITGFLSVLFLIVQQDRVAAPAFAYDSIAAGIAYLATLIFVKHWDKRV